MNYGVPLTGFQPGSPDPLISDADAMPKFAGNDAQNTILLGSDSYPNWASAGPPTVSTYNSATIQRIAGWNALLSEPGVLQDQNSFNGIQLSTVDLPCTTGVFAAMPVYSGTGPYQDPTGTGQFWPGLVPTPCNTPWPPTSVAASYNGSVVSASWNAPSSLGLPTRPDYPLTLGSYLLTFTNGGTTKSYNTSATTFQTPNGDITPGNWNMKVQAQTYTGTGTSPLYPLTLTASGSISGPPGASSSSCAGEGGSCGSLPVGSWVAFGAAGSYEFAQVPSSGSFSCGDGSFPIDPNVAVTKSCYSYGAPPQGPLYQAQVIAAQGAAATLPAVELVSYGSDITRPLNGTFTCNATTFGWTASDDHPNCYLLSPQTPSTPTGAPGFTFCSSFGGTCNSSNQLVSIGNGYPASSLQAYFTATGQSGKISCQNTSPFPNRPTGLQGETLFCDTIPTNNGVPAGWTQCADEESVCKVPSVTHSGQGAVIGFGNPSDGKFLFQYFSYSDLQCNFSYCAQYCDRSNFKTDPDSGADKPCYLYNSSTPAGSSVRVSEEAISLSPKGAGSAYGTSQQETLTNNGTAALTFSSISIQSSSPANEFTVSGCTSSVAVGASCILTINYSNPVAAGATADLDIVSNSPASPTNVPIVAGVPRNQPAVSLSTQSLAFQLQAGSSGYSSDPQPVTLTNSGSSNLSVSSIQIGGSDTGDFSETDNCVGTIGAGASCTINVVFTDNNPNGGSANVQIFSNAASSPNLIQVSGRTD